MLSGFDLILVEFLRDMQENNAGIVERYLKSAVTSLIEKDQHQVYSVENTCNKCNFLLGQSRSNNSTYHHHRQSERDEQRQRCVTSRF